MLIRTAGEEVTTINAAVNLNKLLQLSSGAVYSDTGEVIEFDASNRLRVLKEAIDESSHKVLVFVPFRHAIEIINDELVKDGYTVDLIHGGVPVNRRTEIFKRFQETANPRVLIIQPQAASHGVTLHAANTIVWWGPITSYETYAQANARVHRSGQKNPCTVIRLTGSKVEKKLYEALASKQDVQHNIMALYDDLIS
jgi:SNF2 family DNA or RNA helicase